MTAEFNPSTIHVADSVLEIICAHLAAAYPNEGCGVLIGKKRPDQCVEIQRAVGTRNAETVRGEDRFSIHPLDYLAVERELDLIRDGSRIVGFFHSHPDSLARPSSIDLEMAQGLFDVTQTFYIYSITRVESGEPRETTFWRLSHDATQFEAC